jgi:hypothetical protein
VEIFLPFFLIGIHARPSKARMTVVDMIRTIIKLEAHIVFLKITPTISLSALFLDICNAFILFLIYNFWFSASAFRLLVHGHHLSSLNTLASLSTFIEGRAFSTVALHVFV